MDIEILKKQLLEYVKREGRTKALAELLEHGVGYTTADRLVEGNYSQKIPTRRIRSAIERVLGIGKAS